MNDKSTELEQRIGELEKQIDTFRTTEEELTVVEEELRQSNENLENAQINLEDSLEKLTFFQENAPGGTIVFEHPSRKIVEVNQTLLDMLDYKKEDLLEKGLFNIIENEYVPVLISNTNDLIETGEKKSYELKLKKSDGDSIPVNMVSTNYPHYQHIKNNIYSTIVDITSIKSAEEKLSKAEKLESIGILAGGIAHDFNNYLAVILGNISLAKSMIDSGGKAYTLLEMGEKACVRAANLTKQLLTFSKGGSPIKSTASILELLVSTTDFILSGSNVKAEYFLSDLQPAEIDIGQISQVISNMVLNAKQAMPKGGIVRIYGDNVTLKSEEVGFLEEGNYVRIKIQDSGAGIPKEDFLKIFEPYFTTKSDGNGLGLATSYSIIKKHGGDMGVESELDHGTTFTIYLPTSNKPLEEIAEEEYETAVHPSKILIMDDEPMIVDMVKSMLNVEGYEVVGVNDGQAAISEYMKAKYSQNPFDAVIMDLTIPGGMGGKEAITKLKEMDPNIKAIVSSGYSNDPVMANYKDYGFSGACEKPYGRLKLNDLLNSVLGPIKQDG